MTFYILRSSTASCVLHLRSLTRVSVIVNECGMVVTNSECKQSTWLTNLVTNLLSQP